MKIIPTNMLDNSALPTEKSWEKKVGKESTGKLIISLQRWNLKNNMTAKIQRNALNSFKKQDKCHQLLREHRFSKCKLKLISFLKISKNLWAKGWM